MITCLLGSYDNLTKNHLIYESLKYDNFLFFSFDKSEIDILKKMDSIVKNISIDDIEFVKVRPVYSINSIYQITEIVKKLKVKPSMIFIESFDNTYVDGYDRDKQKRKFKFLKEFSWTHNIDFVISFLFLKKSNESFENSYINYIQTFCEKIIQIVN